MVATTCDRLPRQETATLTGHQKYLHAVSHCPATGLMASASEDGSVRLWDARLKKACTATLVPSARSELARGKCGQWVGAACLTSDWVVSKYKFYVFSRVTKYQCESYICMYLLLNWWLIANMVVGGAMFI